MAETTVNIVLGAFGRWVIVDATDPDFAWSGAQWVTHFNGIPATDVQVCNFATRDEAADYWRHARGRGDQK